MGEHLSPLDLSAEISIFTEEFSEKLLALTTLFVEQPGGEKDVVDAGDDGEAEDYRIDSGQVAAQFWKAGGDENGGDGYDLDGCIDLTEPGRAKPPEAGHDIDCRRT